MPGTGLDSYKLGDLALQEGFTLLGRCLQVSGTRNSKCFGIDQGSYLWSIFSVVMGSEGEFLPHMDKAMGLVASPP